ncbi:MAG: haloacid dehalogenase-like hydrolase [Alphaproteobacteria bacterium]|nr:haloacid dehalogenase-like hydrolase [Alphaproteobacteria bacterium]
MTPMVLWDIDGTLLNTGGAGRDSLNEAFERIYGVPEGFARISFGGRTDLGLLREACAAAGVPFPADRGAALQAAYLPILREKLSRYPLQLCPGVERAVERAAAVAQNALLTGNTQGGAREKLRAVGMWEAFPFGAFGDDAPSRNDLVPIAVQRARAHGVAPGRVVVIGDTPHDVACARAGGAVAVAVCTGWSARAELTAAGPDLLLEDLEQGLEDLMRLIV